MKFFSSTTMLALLLMGCSGIVTHTPLGPATYASVPEASVRIFIDEEPKDPYDKIAIISTNMWKENLATNVEWIRRRGAELGADAVIVFRADSYSSGSTLIAGPMAG